MLLRHYGCLSTSNVNTYPEMCQSRQGSPFPVTYGDVDGDGAVGGTDFLAILGAWGSCTGSCCPADLDLDGDIGVTDFLVLLANWA